MSKVIGLSDFEGHNLQKSYINNIEKGGPGSGRKRNFINGDKKITINTKNNRQHFIEHSTDERYKAGDELNNTEELKNKGYKEHKEQYNKINDLLDYKSIQKSATGEGSRGGKVIGHTKSGKPIYNNANHSSHKSFSTKDHQEAALLHDKKIDTVRGTSRKEGEKSKLWEYHQDQRDFHQSKAREQGIEKSVSIEKGGEGSRGGKVIGHTKSGKAVYARKSGTDKIYSDFTHEDHNDAAKLHDEEKAKHKPTDDELRRNGTKGNAKPTSIKNRDYHNQRRVEHGFEESRLKKEYKHKPDNETHYAGKNNDSDDRHGDDDSSKQYYDRSIKKALDILQTSVDVIEKSSHKNHKYLRIENGRYIYDEKEMTHEDHQAAFEHHIGESNKINYNVHDPKNDPKFEEYKKHMELAGHHRDQAAEKNPKYKTTKEQLEQHKIAMAGGNKKNSFLELRRKEKAKEERKNKKKESNKSSDIEKALSILDQSVDIIEKAGTHKYLRREGTKGNWKYIYGDREKEGHESDEDYHYNEHMRHSKRFNESSNLANSKNKEISQSLKDKAKEKADYHAELRDHHNSEYNNLKNKSKDKGIKKESNSFKSFKDIQDHYNYKDYYVTTLEVQNFEHGSRNVISVSKKTGEKSKYGGDIYEDNKLYFEKQGGTFKEIKDPYKFNAKGESYKN